MATNPLKNIRKELNLLAPAARDARLGDVVYDLINQLNALQADHVALAAKYGALLAHLDAANLAAIGTANAATYAPPAGTAAAVKLPEQR